MYDFLFRPGGLVDDGGGGLYRIRTLQKRGLDFFHKADGEENHHRGPMGGQRGQPLPLRDRGAALHPGDDDGLADTGQCVLGIQCRRRAAKAGHAGGVVIGNACGVQCVHLLTNCAIQAGVARVEPYGCFVRCFVLFHHGKHLFQRHFRAVVNGAVRLCKPQQRRVD